MYNMFVCLKSWMLKETFTLFRFDGRVVAKLPFTPISWLQGISHRNLIGEDYTDCSFIFLYILCTMSIRQVSSIQSYLSKVNTFCIHSDSVYHADIGAV